MDIANLGIVIDPTKTKEGSAEVKAELKSIEVSAKETQAGVVAAFENTATKQKIVIRDSAAASQSAEKATTATTQGESNKRRQITATEAAANQAAVQARLAATQAAMEATSRAEIAAATRASRSAIEAANATKENALAVSEAIKAGKLQEAQAAMEAARSSAAATKEALNEMGTAARSFTTLQKEQAREQMQAAQAAAKESAEAMKTATTEMKAAERDAAKVAIEQARAAADAVKAAEREKAKAAQQAAKEREAAARQAGKAERDNDRGWLRFERGLTQLLVPLGLITDKANTALNAMQAMQAGAAIAGIGFAALSGVLVVLAAAIAAIAGAAIIFTAIKKAAEFEPIENQLRNVVGGFEEVEKRMVALREFQREAPLFPIDQIVKANRDLQTFSAGALATRDGMKLVGNAALVTGAQIDQVGLAVGKFYAAVQAKQPIKEYVSQLLSMRVLHQENAIEIMKLSDAKASPAKIWEAAERALHMYDGALEQYGRTTQGTFERIKVQVDQAFEALGKPLLPAVQAVLTQLETRLQGLVPLASRVGYGIAGAIKTASWAEVWEYIGLQMKAGLNAGGAAFVAYMKEQFKSIPGVFVQEFKSEWEKEIKPLLQSMGMLVAAPLMSKPFASRIDDAQARDSAVRNRIGGTVGTYTGPRTPRGRAPGPVEPPLPVDGFDPLFNNPGGSGEPNADAARMAEIEEGWKKAGEALAKADADEKKKLEEKTGTPAGPGGGNTAALDAATKKAGSTYGVDTDAKIMGEFFTKLNELTWRMQTGEVSKDEFKRREGQLQDQTTTALGDPKKWEEFLGKWRVFNEEKKRIAEETDRRIAAGEANMFESFNRGLQKAADAWGNTSQQMAKLGEGVANSLTNNISAGLTAIVTGSKDAKTAFRDMAVAILNDIAKMIIQLLVELAVRTAIKAITGFATGGSVGGTQASSFGSASSQASSGLGDQAAPAYLASGGTIRGGSGGIDDIPAWLTAGEYVIKRDSAAFYGRHFLDAINDKRVRRFAEGGAVAAASGRQGAMTAAAGSTHAGINIGINVDASSKGENRDPQHEQKRGEELKRSLDQHLQAWVTMEKRAGGLLTQR